MSTYHEAELAGLLANVADAVRQYRDGELDPFDMDRMLFQYSRAAKELWKYCSSGNVEVVARYIREDPAIDWWERGAITGR